MLFSLVPDPLVWSRSWTSQWNCGQRWRCAATLCSCCLRAQSSFIPCALALQGHLVTFMGLEPTCASWSWLEAEGREISRVAILVGRNWAQWLGPTVTATLQNLGFLWKMWKSAFVLSCFISSILFPLGAQEWLLHASPVKMNVVSQGETRTWWAIEASEYRKCFSIRRFRLLLGCPERLFKDFIVLCLQSFLSLIKANWATEGL